MPVFPQASAVVGESYAVLSSDISAINTQTTLQDVTGLALTIGSSATEIWHAVWLLFINAANATMDAKVGFTVPASCTMRWGPVGDASGLAVIGSQATGNTPISVLSESGTFSSGTPNNGTTGILIHAVVFGGGTGGAVQPKYAQNTSDAGNVQVKSGSLMRALKVAS